MDNIVKVCVTMEKKLGRRLNVEEVNFMNWVAERKRETDPQEMQSTKSTSDHHEIVSALH